MKFCLRFLFVCIFLAGSLKLSSQEFYKGIVRDASGGQTLTDVSIQSSDKGSGTLTDKAGYFQISPIDPNARFIISHIGYKPDTMLLLPGRLNIIQLQPDIVGLDEINIISTFARERETPVAVSTIKSATIERELGHQDYPEIMKMVPGVYATKLGGGSGDARISIRGFQQENIALLLNGVPVSSVENGLVYWSNWTGLSEATQTIQVQRGLGASRVALNSVGGTINIITKPAESRRGGSFQYSITDYGNHKTTISLSSGQLKNGFAFTFLGSRTNGPGLVDATAVNAWSWFISMSKEINKSHRLVFTGMGSPERHGQRNYGLTIEEYNKFGGKYNPNWGIFNGEINSLSENFYHKPQLALNHYWDINNRALLSSSVYLSFGDGGGKYSESFMSPPANTFRKNNQIDWDAIYLQNISNPDTFQLTDGRKVNGFSKIIQTNYLASHWWLGGLTNLNWQINNKLKVITGLHTRYFKSNLREEISDLMGGNFWIDTYGWAIEGIGGRNQLKTPGDIINVDNDSRVDVVSYFIQGEYTSGKMSLFLASTVSNTWYRRADRINYIQNTDSEIVTKPGADIKAGINFNPDANSNLYLNAGFFSKAPYFKFMFTNFSNAVARNQVNEKITSAEIGYSYSRTFVKADINLYYTLWQDKSLLSKENIQLENNAMTRALIRGLDAVHKGIELELASDLTEFLNIGLSASAGDWRWKNDVNALLYNDQHELIDSTSVYVKDIKVGDAPQLTFGIYAETRPGDGWTIGVRWMFYGRLYANFDPAGRNNPGDRAQPFRIPDYNTGDLYVSRSFNIGNQKAMVSAGCYNLSGKESIMRGEDGSSHQADTFTGFWSPGRTFNFSIKLSF